MADFAAAADWASARARRAASDWSSNGPGLDAGADFDGAKLGALADAFAGRGVLAGGAACGRKLGAVERAELLEAELGELLAGRLTGRAAELDGAELEALGDDGGVRPGVLVRPAPPPLAAARAAAASAGLEAPRTGATGLFVGAGVVFAGVEKAELERPLGAGAGRVLLDADCDDGLDGAAVGRLLPDPDEVEAPEDGGVGRDPPEGAGAGRVGAGRAGAVVDRGVAGAGAALVTADDEVGAAEPSGRAPAGRTRVASSAPASPLPLDATFGDASVLIGIVPPPGICRDVFSDRWLLSELTFTSMLKQPTRNRVIPRMYH